MAPEKRTSSGRRDTLLDEDDDVDAISPKRMRTNARDSTANDTTPRRSNVRGSARPVPLANASDSDGVVTPDQDEADAQQEQDEDDEDEDEDDDEQDEIDSDEDRAEEERRQAEADRGYAQSGIVEKIELRNFMCHANFSIELSPTLNFIMGRNGSGKSTILTALMIALGGKTSSTNRGSSLKDLVKKGESSATITVTVRNQGSDAFRPEAYGDHIVIERRILADGPATWKMKAANGRVVATTKSELESFCDFANIQPDNPIHILTQDTARQFLGSSDPSEVYKFFLEGTQLSQLVREYTLIENHISGMRSALALKSGALKQLEALAQQALQQWQKVRETRGYQDKIDALDREFVWVQVHDAHAQLEHAVLKTERIRTKLVACDKSLNECLDALKQCEERIVRLEGESNNFDDDFTPLQQEYEGLVRKQKDISNQIKAFNVQERELNDNISELNKGIERYEDQIREETAKLADEGKARREQLEQERQALQTQRQTLQDEVVEKDEQLRELDAKREDAARREQEETDRLQRLKNEYQRNSSGLTQLRDSARNRLVAYGGSKVPVLLQAINNEPGWRSKPIGPLGTHVKLKDMRWQRADAHAAVQRPGVLLGRHVQHQRWSSRLALCCAPGAPRSAAAVSERRRRHPQSRGRTTTAGPGDRPMPAGVARSPPGEDGGRTAEGRLQARARRDAQAQRHAASGKRAAGRADAGSCAGQHLGARRRQARDGDAEGGDHAAVRGDPDTEGRGGRAEGAGASRDPGDRRTQAPVRGADEQPPGASGNGRGGASQANQQPRLLEAEALQHPRGRRGERARGGDSRRGSPLPGGEGQGVLRRGGDAAHDGRDRGGEEAAAAAQEEGGVRGGRESGAGGGGAAEAQACTQRGAGGSGEHERGRAAAASLARSALCKVELLPALHRGAGQEQLCEESVDARLRGHAQVQSQGGKAVAGGDHAGCGRAVGRGDADAAAGTAAFQQGYVWWRAQFRHGVPAALAVAGHELADSMSGRIRHLYGPGQPARGAQYDPQRGKGHAARAVHYDHAAGHAGHEGRDGRRTHAGRQPARAWARRPGWLDPRYRTIAMGISLDFLLGLNLHVRASDGSDDGSARQDKNC
ncbi:hypothetical protein L1887_58698 [Cichorium endivia]|nr:hypothetical protein L1887_58698 [Cichorium endivia]